MGQGLNLMQKVRRLKLTDFNPLFNKLEKLRTALIEVKDVAEIAALKTFEANMKQRIFDNSTGTSGEVFGTYRSEAYKDKRKKAGRQTDIKDLQFSGEFKKDLQIGTSGGKNVLGFKTQRSIDIAIGQQEGSKTRYGTFVKQINIPIFTPQQEEIDFAFEEYSKVINDKIIETLNV